MLGLIQFNPVRGEVDANLAALVVLARGALDQGAKLLVLPEMAATGYCFASPDQVRPLAESVQGKTFNAFASLASEYRAHIVVGFAESADDGKLYNSAFAVSPEGGLAAHYRKRLLYELDYTWATPGDLPYPLFTTPQGTATIGICMDLNSDEFPNYLRATQPDIACFPTNWIDQNLDYIHQYWAWRLRGYTGTLIAANRWGHEDGTGFWGRSAFLRRGKVLRAASPVGDEWLVME